MKFYVHTDIFFRKNNTISPFYINTEIPKSNTHTNNFSIYCYAKGSFKIN